MKITSFVNRNAALIAGFAVLSAPHSLLAQNSQLGFECSFENACGTLVQVGCWEHDGGFLLKYSAENGFSAVLDNEIWTSKKVEVAAQRKDLTSSVLDAPSGEVGLLTVDQEWNFSWTVHYTGQGEGMDWFSATGICEAMK